MRIAEIQKDIRSQANKIRAQHSQRFFKTGPVSMVKWMFLLA